MKGIFKKVANITARLPALSKPSRERTEFVLHWIADSPATMVVFNLFLWMLLGFVRLRQRAGRVWFGIVSKVLPDREVVESQLELKTGEAFPARPTRVRPRVLLVIEETVPQCFRYRVEQKIHQLNALGWDSEWISWRHGGLARERMHLFDIVLFYRVPGFSDVLLTIRYAKAINKIVIYDTDDLIFDRARLEEKFKGGSGQLSQHDYEQMLKGAELYRSALKLCDYATTTTPALQNEIERVIGKGRCAILPNALDQTVFEVLDTPMAQKPEGVIRLIYGSGTRTHDADFALVGEVLARLMDKHPNLELIIIGFLTLPVSLESYVDRIQRMELMDFDVYLTTLRYADISIAPLEEGIFADCKSEIKWLEAGVFGIPSVVTPTSTYRDVIDPGVDGFFANNEAEWEKTIGQLIESESLRRQVGEAARVKARANYGRKAMQAGMANTLNNFQTDMCKRGLCYPQKQRKRILIVHTIYPPEIIGGATVVVIRSVEELQRKYGNDLDIVVLKSELTLTSPYQVTEYVWKGTLVQSVGIPPEKDFEWRYRDEYLKKLFDEYLAYFKPDLIHFHCVQRLTGTLLESAAELSIPYVVTVHDAWWLSEHQFLLDEEANLVDFNQLNPLVVAQTSPDTAAAIKRSTYLTKLLAGAEKIYAVSEYQAALYRQNGLTDIAVNKNGLPPVKTLAGTPSPNGKLRLGYVGGVCDHKGYYQLRRALESIQCVDLECHIIDLDADHADIKPTGQWGATDVFIWGRQTPEGMDDFYTAIDVLVAPSVWPESFGLVTREAALRGRWVVAAQAGGMAEDVIPERTGFTYPMRDDAALKAVLMKLNADARYYLENDPDIESSRAQITSLEDQIDELAHDYQQLIHQ
ncbi:MAG: glycosyltransferase [Proteobacteria bacterium]|jgi:glycosyltransferase involved in cell wall biosynthesis|nr:glycosyltransferase [Pseudomonadota bacterium]